ncbi:DNA processing protein [Natronocella acetinitrilica]|uniref:DNA processing protein n=1 Tax=Natronocella acetinitrilica TaxID=414046 RepID=A0AAE3KAE8_9GAMM|nr:DNA-processing protein DprA [Natronocella acetinitrilica]MCP1673311.1 DNA processing protein [Natronocella acetinitrilica]
MSDLHHRLALWRLPAIGPRAYSRLLETFGSARAALGASASAWQRLDLDQRSIDALGEPDWAGADADVAWLESSPLHHILQPGDPSYPEQLEVLPAVPPLLFVTGDPDILRLPQVAVIGSRRPTSGGRDTASAFSAHLAKAGLVITSGLALGVDSAAHAAAVDANGLTIAVAGTGPDRVYPPRNRDLARRIVDTGGAVVSEFPTGMGARRENFPRRNRIISGLALGTLVVEAGLRSGSLITARYALEQGREVFAIPGSIHNPLAKGCHALIREGQAKLVEQAGEILEELLPHLHLPETQRQQTGPEAAHEEQVDSEHTQVLEALGHDPITIDTLHRRTGLTPAVLSSILLIMELQGQVETLPGGRYARAG